MDVLIENQEGLDGKVLCHIRKLVVLKTTCWKAITGNANNKMADQTNTNRRLHFRPSTRYIN